VTWNALSPPEFRGALQKGLGRALLTVRQTGDLIDEAVILDACTHNRAYDPQCEGSRAGWMMELLDAAGAAERLRTRILAAMAETTDTWDLDQLCGLAEIYARRGCVEARDALFGVFVRCPDPTAGWLGAEAIVNLDGMSGFLHAAAERSPVSKKEDWWRDFEVLVDRADELCGSKDVDGAVDEAARDNADLGGFQDGLRAYRKRQRKRQASNGPSAADRMRAIPARQIIDEIAIRDPKTVGYRYTPWGRFAPEEALETIVAAMFSETHPGSLAKFLRVFRRQALPRFDNRLIAYADHPDGEVRDAALAALAMNACEGVRALALARLRDGLGDGATLTLLARNYRPGDHERIRAALGEDDYPHALHDTVRALNNIFIEHEAPDGHDCLLFGYEQTPCALCRGRIVKHLVKQGQASEDMLEECRYDSNEDTRETVQAVP
jgi:hypothetical protein